MHVCIIIGYYNKIGQMLLQSVKVSVLILTIYVSYITYNKYQQLLDNKYVQHFDYNHQRMQTNQLWNSDQFQSRSQSKFKQVGKCKDTAYSIDNTNEQIILNGDRILFGQLGLDYEDVRTIHNICLIDQTYRIIQIKSRYFVLLYSLDEKIVRYQHIYFMPTQQQFYFDPNGNLWIWTHPHHNILLLRVYDKSRRLIKTDKHQFANEEKVQLINQIILQKNSVSVKLLTFSRNYITIKYNPEQITVVSQTATKSHTFEYSQNILTKLSISLSQKVLQLQQLNNLQQLIYTLTLGYFGRPAPDLLSYRYNQPQYGMAALDPYNNVVLQFDQYYNDTQVVSFGDVLIPLKTPVFVSKTDQDKLVEFGQLLNMTRDKQQVPVVDFKLYTIKDRDLEIIRGKNGLYRLTPDAKVHFMAFDHRMITFYPKENLNQDDHYMVRIQNGGVVMKGAQIKGIFEQVPVPNPKDPRLKFGYSQDQIYHQQTTSGSEMIPSIYEAHAVHKGLFVKTFKSRIQLITSLSGQAILTHYLSTKSKYKYSTSFIENNEFWVFEHKQGSQPLITKYQLFVNASAVKSVLSIKRNYQLGVNGRIVRVQKCVDYFYYFQYITHDYRYGVVRVHQALMTNRQARPDGKYAGAFQKMMIIEDIQRNTQFKISEPQEHIISVQFTIDPKIVKNWKQLQLKLQFRILPLRVYNFKNEYFIFDIRRLMLTAFYSQIVHAKFRLYNKMFLFSTGFVFVLSLFVLYGLYKHTKEKREQNNDEPVKQEQPVDNQDKKAETTQNKKQDDKSAKQTESPTSHKQSNKSNKNKKD